MPHTTPPQPERESSRKLNQLKTALDEHSIVAITDTNGVITYVNDKFCVISQYARTELLGQTHRLINSGTHSREFFRELWRTIAGGQVWKGEICNRRKDGSDYWVETTIVPFLDDKGKPYEYIAIRTDVTIRKQQQEEIVQLLENKLNKTIKTLEGILPICGYCKDIRNPDNTWSQMEEYISQHSQADFSHTVCPKCMQKHHPDVSSRSPL